MNLHVFQVRLKQRKVYSHPSSLASPSPISPSSIPPSPNTPSRLLGQFDYLNIRNISHNGRQKSGTKSTGVLLFVPLWRFYTVLFTPLFCRLREIVKNDLTDNMWQKDIKTAQKLEGVMPS